MRTAERSEPRLGDRGALRRDAITVEGLRKRIGRVSVVSDLSLHVPHGSIYGLIGPNGAGKTTTMRVLATLERPDEGMVLLDGVDVRTNPRAARERTGYLPDAFGVYEELTAREYLDFFAACGRVPRRQRRQLTDELLELVDLVPFRDVPVGRLSRGMTQRLGVARCLVHDPVILLLDEPAAGMDPLARIELRDVLRELARLGKTIVLSSHVLAELVEVCTHVGIMHGGRLVTEAPLDVLLAARVAGTRVRVRVANAAQREPARAVLEAHPTCLRIAEEDDGLLSVDLSCDATDLPDILAHLVAAGVRVVTFDVAVPTLDELFLDVTEMSEDET